MLTHSHKSRRLQLTSKILRTIIVASILLATPAFAAEQPKTPTVAELQQQIETLQILVQTVQDQRNSVLDQLALAQTVIRQEQNAKAQAAQVPKK